MQATQALTQVQGVLFEQRSATEWEKLSLQAKWDKEKAYLQQDKEQLIAEQLEIKEQVNRSLLSVIVIEMRDKEQIP